MSLPLRKAVFPVAGLGTRFLPVTKAAPKELLPIVDRPLIQYAVDEAARAGVEEFIFVVGPGGPGALQRYFEPDPRLEGALRERNATALLELVTGLLPAGARVRFATQAEPLGLGHAVLCARDCIGDEPFAVLLPDELLIGEPPCLAAMEQARQRCGGNLVAVIEVPADQTDRYGIIRVDGEDQGLLRVGAMVEKPQPAAAPSRLALVGRYILEPAIFAQLERGQRGAGGEIQLTDGMAALLSGAAFWAQRHTGLRFDCGGKAGFLEANIALALARADLAPAMRAILQRYGSV